MYLAARHPDVDDMTQRALIEVLHAAGSFRGESSLETWADRIATRAVFRMLKRHKTVETREEPVEQLPEYPDWSHTPNTPAERSDQRRAMIALLDRLPPERRRAIVLKHVHGYSVEEVAQETQTNLNTVRDRLRVARAQLRKWLSGESGGDDDEA